MSLPLDTILQGDALERLKELPADSVDFICTDPPYGIGFMGKEWDTFSPNNLAAGVERSSRKDGDLAQAAVDKDPRRSRAGKGSIAMEAARYDHTPQGQRRFREWWHEISMELLRVLKPGAFAAVCIGARQDSVAACITAMSEAGFKCDFTSLFWAYASGFPKAANISKMIDKREGVEFDVRPAEGVGFMNDNDDGYNTTKNQMVRKGDVSKRAKPFIGAYGGYQPKPAMEVIVVAMKPLSEKTFVDQALKNGKGVSWLDGGRIPSNDTINATSNQNIRGGKYKSDNSGSERDTMYTPHGGGRFPANLLVSDGVLAYDSRYFDLGRWAKTLPFLNVPKPAPSEKNGGSKNHHPTVKPVALMSYLITLFSREGDIVLDPFVGSGTTCVAASKLKRRYIGIDREQEYVDLASARLKHAERQGTLL